MSEFVSGAVGAVLGAILVFVSSQRALRAENVLAERTKWREEIRRIAKELPVVNSDKRRLASELALRLNPADDKDREIVKLAANGNETSAELTTRLALLLKHDWERAKIEASWFPYFVKLRVKRETYDAKRLLF